MSKTSKKDLKTRIRKIAVDLLDEGWNQSKVAAFLGVSQGSVSNWQNAFKKEGDEGLKVVPNIGRPSRLSSTQKEQLKTYLNEGAEASGFTGNFWTQKRISRLIKEKFSIEIKPRQCGNILKELDYVLKLPQTKSYEQDLEKVETWKIETIPEIKKKAKERNALILFADESSFSLFPNLVKSYFPKGTPAIMKRFLRFKALTPSSVCSPQL